MLKIFEFYVLLLFTVGYHGNQNIFFSMYGEMCKRTFIPLCRISDEKMYTSVVYP